MKAVISVSTAFLLVVAVLGCDAPVKEATTAASPAGAAAPPGPHAFTVCATASLRRPFEAIAARYEQDHAGAKITLHFDGGTQLLNAMNTGKKCDVIAVGDSSVMARIVSAGHTAVGSPAELARSRVAIVVAKGNPKQVKGLADFGRADLRVALGASSSSIGRHSRWALSHLKITPTPAVQATTADGVLAKIAAAEADAGIVYVTSFAGASEAVERIDVPEAENTPALYSISTAREPQEPRGAEAFRALALGPTGQQLLHDAGFLQIGEKLH